MTLESEPGTSRYSEGHATGGSMVPVVLPFDVEVVFGVSRDVVVGGGGTDVPLVTVPLPFPFVGFPPPPLMSAHTPRPIPISSAKPAITGQSGIARRCVMGWPSCTTATRRSSTNTLHDE